MLCLAAGRRFWPQAQVVTGFLLRGSAHVEDCGAPGWDPSREASTGGRGLLAEEVPPPGPTPEPLRTAQAAWPGSALGLHRLGTDVGPRRLLFCEHRRALALAGLRPGKPV